MFIALWFILFWDNIVCYLNCLKENEVKLFYQRWREKEADTEALKGNRTVNRRGKKNFCFFLLFKTLSVSLVKLGVNIDLERLYLSFLEKYFYGQMELRFRFILSSTWPVSLRLLQRAMDVHPSHPGQACLSFTFFPPENPVESFKWV